jgi:dTDP-4-amino-4,6-dideoxygalactose transaminase
MGQKYGRTSGDLSATRDLSERLVRLPLWLGIESELERIIEQVIVAAE